MENENKKYSLIIAVVNRGYLDLVMQAARKKGARGGTTFHAHGTGNPDAEKYFGVPIQPEKDMVYIIVEKDIKEEVLLEIYKEAGLSTQGQGICFSIDLDEVIGLTPYNEKEMEENK